MKHQKWPKRDSIKNYFPVPNEVFLLGLSPGELAVYYSMPGLHLQMITI